MSTAEAPSPAAIEGYLDEAGPERVRGWAWIPERPDEATVIEIADRRGRRVAQAEAASFRGDLEAAAKRSGRCAFDLALPAAGGPFRVVARASSREAQDLVLAEGVQGLEPEAEPEPPARLSGPEGIVGWLDRADADEISGWCHADEPFAEPIVLELVEAGRAVASAQADIWRNDLEDLRQGDGRCGFRFDLPDALYDGREHLFELRLPAGAALAAAPFAVTLASVPPERPEPVEPRRPPAGTPPAISVIVNFFQMQREAARTLHSLSRAFQRDVEDLAYEVLCVDNGSDPALDEDFISGFGPEFRLVRPSTIKPSPCFAMNEAALQAKGRWLAVMIDGAHVVSPGVLSEAHQALQTQPRGLVALRQWFIGGDQRWFSTVGYSRGHEDVLFARIDWPNEGYKVFDIAAPMYESPNSWFDGMGETNCLFLPAELYRRLGGFDEAFDMAGAGFANLDLFRRAVDAADGVTAIVGEASFHQYHGGTTTNVGDLEKDNRVRAYASHYAQVRGQAFASVPPEHIRLSGAIRTGAALTARQRAPTPLRLGLTQRVRPRPSAIQFDEQAQRYLQAAYVEAGGHLSTRWRGREIGLAPSDLVDLQEALWRVRPEVVILRDTTPALVEFVASLAPALGLEGARLVWVGGEAPAEGLPPAVERIDGEPGSEDAFLALQARVGAAEHVLVVFQPRPDEQLPVEALSRYSWLVTFGSYLVVLGAAFGQPWLGYSQAWTYRAIARFVNSHPGFVIDRTLSQHFVTTSPGGFLRRALDPLLPERYDSALDDLSDI